MKYWRCYISLGIIALGVLLTTACTPSATPVPAPGAVAASNFVLTSNAFTEGNAIPKKYACDGDKVSPELEWSGAPPNTKSFALIVDDQDAPIGTFTHWVAFDLPTSQNEIAENANAGGKGGSNSGNQLGYYPPCPPIGTHRYFFTLYALNVETLGLKEGASRADVEKAMNSHVLAKTQLMGKYSK